MKTTTYAAPAIALILALAGCARPDVAIDAAWVRTPLPGKQMTAAYFVVHNATDSEAVLTKVDATNFGAADMHETRSEDGMMHMAAVDSVPVAPGQRVAFSPGGLHIMLMRPQRQLEPGDTVRLTLTFADGSTRAVEAVVRDRAP